MAEALARQPLHLKFPASSGSVTEARHTVEEYARAVGMSNGNVGNVALAVTEAVANAVTHAYRARDAGTIELRAELLVPDTLLVVVTDDGEGMSPHPGHSGLGLGIPLIGSLTTGVEIEPHRPHGTSVRMRFALAPQEE